MKNFIIILFALTFSYSLRAQSNVEPLTETYRKQVGISFTNFALRFLSFNEASGGTPSIIILYKKGNDKTKWRFGYGGRVNWMDRPNNGISSSQVNLNFNWGKEYHRPISRKWRTYFGWENMISSGYSKTSFISSNTQFPSSNVDELFSAALGFRGLFGLQYNFTNRLSLLTETGYGLNLGFQQDENKNKAYFINTFFNAPISLILNYHF